MDMPRAPRTPDSKRLPTIPAQTRTTHINTQLPEAINVVESMRALLLLFRHLNDRILKRSYTLETSHKKLSQNKHQDNRARTWKCFPRPVPCSYCGIHCWLGTRDQRGHGRIDDCEQRTPRAPFPRRNARNDGHARFLETWARPGINSLTSAQ